ncbi:hypothetical protein JNM87_03195 [Candidatus Saccharibacteria bacterium]|nr:hypothetical protein [Candidatus Saccharibacteria bacterium]
MAAQVDGEIAIGYPNTVVIASSSTIAVVVGLGPKKRTARSSVIDLELDVVVAIGSDGTSTGLQASLEVQVVAGGGVGVGGVRAYAREEKQG